MLAGVKSGIRPLSHHARHPGDPKEQPVFGDGYIFEMTDSIIKGKAENVQSSWWAASRALRVGRWRFVPLPTSGKHRNIRFPLNTRTAV